MEDVMAGYSWKDVKDIVRSGEGERKFPLGTQFPVRKIEEDGKERIILFDVVDHDRHPVQDGTHSMLLLMHDTWYGHAMDTREAIVFCETDLLPGTYSFTVERQKWFPEDNGRTYSFTVDQTITGGSQLYLDMKYNEPLEGKIIEAYDCAGNTVPYCKAMLHEGKSGEFLGTADGSCRNVNYMHRAIFGSNSYRESAMRQWLNSSEPSGLWWKAQTRFDRPPAYAWTDSGFLYGMDEDFIDVLNYIDIETVHNNTYEQDHSEGTGKYRVRDRIFIPDLRDVGFEDEGENKSPYHAFESGTNDCRMKVNMDYPSIEDNRWWLRSPDRNNASSYYVVAGDGSLFVHTGYVGFGIAAACVI